MNHTFGGRAVLAASLLLGACAGDDASDAKAPHDGPALAPRDKALTSAADLPCDVAPIIKKNCSLCHGAEPSFGAPMALEQSSDFSSRAAAVSRRVNLTGPGRMPPVSAPALSSAELSTLTAWLDGGAKPASPGCTIDGESQPAADPATPPVAPPAVVDVGKPATGPSTGAPSGGTDADVPPPSADAGTPRLGADAGAPTPGTSVQGPTSGSGGAHREPIDYQDPDLKCYKFTAYAGAGRKDAPYSVPTTPDHYVNFTIKAPWTGTQYIRSFRSIVDNKAVLHHWLFFRALSPKAEGVMVSTGAHPDDEMLYGWAPGGDNLYFDKDLAMEAPSGAFLVEAHYNNTTGRAAPDASGVEICVTPNKPDKVAGLSWVGSDAILGTSATGTCRPDAGKVAHIVAAQPHMHKKGVRMKVVHTNGLRQSTVVHDQPFDFNYQRMYLETIDVAPGDTLTTTCTYSAPSRFGPSTNDEMCYFFSIHWPNGALKSRGSFGGLLHGPNTCM